jgi:sulfide:quinone oxidoreductase
MYKPYQILKSKQKFIPKGVNVIFNEVLKINTSNNEVLLTDSTIKYDLLIIASGTTPRPNETPGLADELWYRKIFDFYTSEGAEALYNFFEKWEGGKLVMTIVDMPIKCPVAPIEFVCLADDYFTKRGMRDKVQISFVTPMSAAFTKPIAAKMFGNMLEQKNIEVIPDFYIESIDNTTQELVSYDERRIKFDCLTIVPLNKGADFVAASGLGDDLNYVKTNKHTLQSEMYENIFALGDATNIPASKAGSVVHFAAEVAFENIMSFINNQPLTAKFDGHSNCYIESGKGKAALIDFNYETEPLTGTYPLAGVGPFKLLKLTRINHWGKLAFKWIYWNVLLKARWLPVSNAMSMSGKNVK